MAKLKSGTYKGRAIPNSAQHGTTENGHPQIAMQLQVSMGQGQRDVVPLYLVFSDKSAPFSIERLRALGWEGNDLRDLKGIDRNYVDVRIDYEDWVNPETKQTEAKLRVDVLTGIRMDRPLKGPSLDSFAERFKALAEKTPVVQSAPVPTSKNGAPPRTEADIADQDYP